MGIQSPGELPSHFMVNLATPAPPGGAGALCSIDRFSVIGTTIKGNVFGEHLTGCGIRFKSSNSVIVNNTWKHSRLTYVEVAALPNDGAEGPLLINNVTVAYNNFGDATFRQNRDPEVTGWRPPCAFSAGVVNLTCAAPNGSG